MAISNFMKKPASLSLETELWPFKRHATGLHDEELSSYIKVFKYLLALYATDDIITKAIKELERYKQLSGTSAAFYVKRLYLKALCCGIANEEKRVKSLFVEDTDEKICDNMRVCI